VRNKGSGAKIRNVGTWFLGVSVYQRGGNGRS